MDFLKNNRLALHLIMGMLLTIIYPMQELFSGNQNIYFLWGMAEMLPNTFDADPLLNSPDPYPLFSWLISIFPVQFLSVWTTVLYILLNAIYSLSVFGIANEMANIYSHKSRLFSFAAILLFLHSAPIWGTYFNLISGTDLRWVWDSGIAEQGVLRGYLQPSVFGVFLLLSFYFASQRNLTAAILAVAPAAMMHANYLFLGGIVTVVYLIQAQFEKKSMVAAAVLLLTVLPYSIYLLKNFLLLDVDTKSLINAAVSKTFENNIHINPKNWGNAKLLLQIAALFFGYFALRKSHIQKFYLAVLSLSIALTAIAYLLDNTTLISLNPWRFSVMLVPIALAALVAKFVSSGAWSILKPIVIGLIGSICVALVHYRIFGNPSQEFHHVWLLMHRVILLSLLVGSIWLARYEFFEKKFNFLVMFGLVLVGLTDTWIDQQTKAASEEFQAIAKLNGSEPKTVYIIPPAWTSFRMNAQKAVFADENLVYGPALPSLMNRLTITEHAYQSNNFSQLLGTIPNGLSIKLISEDNGALNSIEPSEKLTENYWCQRIR